MTKSIDTQENEQLTVPIFGYELLRDVLLKDILGKETEDILYWSGKSIARKFPCTTLEELSLFFQEAGWGDLQLAKESKKEKIFELSGPFIKRRFSVQADPFFSLESGFLAEQISAQEQAAAESVSDIQKRAQKVQITVKWEQS